MRLLNLISLTLFLSIISFDGFNQNPIEKLYQAGSNAIGIRDMYECANGEFIVGCDYYDTTNYITVAGLMRLSSGGNVLWSNTLDIANSNSSCAFQVIEAANGTYYLNGLTEDSITFEMSAFITNFDNQGNVNWSKSYPMGLSSGGYSINQMELLANDNLLSLISVGDKVFILKTDDLGNIIFGKTITTDTTGFGKNPGFDIIELTNGNILCTSKIESELMVIKLNSLGQTLWTRTHKVGSYIQAHSIVETAQNQIFIAGDLYDTTGVISKPYILELDPLLGDIITIKTLEHVKIYLAGFYHNDLVDINGNLIMTIIANDWNYIPSVFNVILNYNGTIVSSYISENYPVSYYHKMIGTSLNETLIYGSIYLNYFEKGTFIKVATSNLDSSCVFESTNVITSPFFSYSNFNYAYFESPYTISTNINIVSQNITVTAGDLCLKVGVEENEKLHPIEIYPNPASNQFTISVLNQPFDITIYNLLGQVVFSKNNITETYKTIDVSNYGNGVLLVHVTSNGESYMHKIIKQ